MEMKELFEEWDTYAKRRKLQRREIDSGSIISISKLKIAAITGIRRAGKSSELMLLAQALKEKGEKTAYVNLEDSRIKNNMKSPDELIKWFGDKGFLLLDEITSMDKWQEWLARTHEMLKGELKVIASSSRKSLVIPNKPLRGRILPIDMYPLSFREFLSFKGIKLEKTTAQRGIIENALIEYLKYGGFPEVALTEEEADKVRVLSSYFKGIIGLDIAEIAKEDITAVETFGRYVLQSPYFSASKCLDFFKSVGYKIGKEKILSLEHYSQESFLFFFTPIFSYSIKDKAQYPRKAYAGDTGFMFSILGKIDMGRLYENAVFLQLKRASQGQKEICYWKNKAGQEVDFVIKQGANITGLIQAVYELDNEATQKREIDSIIACAKELKAKECIIITKDKRSIEAHEGRNIRFIPLADWLIE